MKAEELIPHGLYKKGKSIVRITAIDIVADACRGIDISNGEDTGWFPSDELSPILITAEILAKNGFERRGGISYHKSIAGLIIHHWNDELCFLNYSKKNIPPIMIPFHYVHELQRALRCCKLDDLADNFKVE